MLSRLLVAIGNLIPEQQAVVLMQCIKVKQVTFITCKEIPSRNLLLFAIANENLEYAKLLLNVISDLDLAKQGEILTQQIIKDPLRHLGGFALACNALMLAVLINNRRGGTFSEVIDDLLALSARLPSQQQTKVLSQTTFLYANNAFSLYIKSGCVNPGLKAWGRYFPHRYKELNTQLEKNSVGRARIDELREGVLEVSCGLQFFVDYFIQNKSEVGVDEGSIRYQELQTILLYLNERNFIDLRELLNNEEISALVAERSLSTFFCRCRSTTYLDIKEFQCVNW